MEGSSKLRNKKINQLNSLIDSAIEFLENVDNRKNNFFLYISNNEEGKQKWLIVNLTLIAVLVFVITYIFLNK